MDQLAEVYGLPKAIRFDNGPEMTTDSFTLWAEERMRKAMVYSTRQPNQYAHIKRFDKSFRDEVLDAKLFNSLPEAQDAADQSVTDYNAFRPHESPSHIAPAEFLPMVFNSGLSSLPLQPWQGRLGVMHVESRLKYVTY